MEQHLRFDHGHSAKALRSRFFARLVFPCLFSKSMKSDHKLIEVRHLGQRIII